MKVAPVQDSEGQVTGGLVVETLERLAVFAPSPSEPSLEAPD